MKTDKEKLTPYGWVMLVLSVVLFICIIILLNACTVQAQDTTSITIAIQDTTYRA